jgi:hypothetical protein
MQRILEVIHICWLLVWFRGETNFAVAGSPLFAENIKPDSKAGCQWDYAHLSAAGDPKHSTELNAEGLPDHDTWIALVREARREAEISGITFSAAVDKIPELKQILDRVYSGHNALSKEVLIHELNDVAGQGSKMSGSVDAFVQSRRFKQSQWWVSSHDSDYYPEQNLANVTSTTSRSPFLRACGENCGREFYWPRQPDGDPDLSNTRIAVNWRPNQLAPNRPPIRRPESIEIIAKDKDGKWQPFFYAKMDTGDPYNPMFLPQKAIKGVQVRDFCIKCHHDENGNFSPLPHFLKTKEDLEAVGYKSHGLIERLLHP